MAMHPDSIIYDEEAKSRKWNYEQGLMLEAFYQMWLHTSDSTYLRYLKKNLDHYIRPDGSISTYELTEFNIDNIPPGRAALRLYEMTGDAPYQMAADTLRKQLALHPRTHSGGFWHKKIYPYQMWLDGLYMGQPFYVLYARVRNEPAIIEDVAHQFSEISRSSRDPVSNLYTHAWDESRTQRWADPQTGRSPNLWGRAIGWFAMALVDVLDEFPVEHPRRKELELTFKELMPNLMKFRDPSTNLWYQVVDRQGSPGNYLEASASAMFTYAMAKGANKGLLPAEYKGRARESFYGIVKHLVEVDPNGLVHLTNVCRVSGLGGNPYRDGSYEYYINEPRRTDDFKGVGPFLLAAIELER